MSELFFPFKKYRCAWIVKGKPGLLLEILLVFSFMVHFEGNARGRHVQGTDRHYPHHLHLTIKPAPADSACPLFILFSGDGGWRSFDEKLADSLNEENIPVIGINSLDYFRRRKTPDEVADDVTAIIREYTEMWHKKAVVLAGYSFGAEIIPFVYNHLSLPTKKQIVLMVLLTPGNNSDFKTHLSDRAGMEVKRWPYNVTSELGRIHDVNILCVWGKNEQSIFPENFHASNIKIHLIPGGHHFKDGKTISMMVKNELINDW